LVVDSLGWPLKIVVHAANTHDSVAAPQVLSGLRKTFPRLVTVLGDGGYAGDLQTWFYKHTKGQARLQIVKRSDAQNGFVPLPKRWIVERSFAWLGHFRRLAKDFEVATSSAQAFITFAFARLALKKLT
jgi:transposase